MNEVKRFYFLNEDVCIRLMLHGEEAKTLFLKNGWQEVKRIDEADFIFINTCSFIKRSEDKAMEKIAKVIREKEKDQEIVVFGCLPGMNPQRLEEIHRGVTIYGRDIENFVRAFALTSSQSEISHEVKRRGSAQARAIKWLNRLFFKDDYFSYLFDKKKAFHLKISEGCRGQCTYCAERLVRGELKSKFVKEIVTEFKRGISKGYRIFSLNADDTGLFGQDHQENIAVLLRKLLKIKQNFKLVITEFNPWAFLKYEKEMTEILSSRKIIFITVPLESGSQKILNVMKRPYQIEKIMPILARIKLANPEIKINTHLIVGFPGESEDDFQKTRSLLRNFYFNKVKVFGYSERPGTEASQMTDKVPAEIIKKRRQILNRQVLSSALKRKDLKAIVLNITGF